MFINFSTCFRRHNTHQQELKNRNCSLWFYISFWLPAAAMAQPSRSKTWVCGRSLAGTAGSNHAGGMDACLLWVFWGCKIASVRRGDQSSRGVLPTAVRRCLWSRNLKDGQAMAHVGPQRHRKKPFKDKQKSTVRQTIFIWKILDIETDYFYKIFHTIFHFTL